MGICFVIQPFDGGPYDERYRDTVRPAILAAGLEPYRVDEDPGVSIPIQDIERGIRQADVCFAEISIDNPNVWFELGFAIAARKPVVMICAETRDRFPFDVQHRAIISYKTESPSDFERLESDITQRLKAAVERQIEIEDISDVSSVAESDGLSPHETAALVAVASYASTPYSIPTHWMVKQDLNRAGFTDIAVTLALRSLLRKDHVAETDAEDERGNPYLGLDVGPAGLEWLQNNQHHLVLRKPEQEPEDDLPF